MKAFGVSALITDNTTGVQVSVLLDFIPTDFSTAELTTPMLNAILVRYNLLDAFKASKIAFSVDSLMVKTVTDLFRQYELEMPIVTYCQTHNNSNIMKR